MPEKYSEIILRISAFGRVYDKRIRTPYFLPNKYDKIKLMTLVDINRIIQLAIYLEELYELFFDESEKVSDLTEDEYNEYRNENYVEFHGEYYHHIRYQYIQILLNKEFIVLDLYEDTDIEGISFSRVELKIENLARKSNPKI